MRVKGLTIKSHISFVEKTYGKGAVAKVLPYLGPTAKPLYSDTKAIRATAWYDLEVQVDFDKAVCKHLAKGDEDVYYQMGAYSAEFGGSSVARETHDPWKFMQLLKAVFNRYFEPGGLEIVKVGEKEAYLSFMDFRSVRENCLTNLGFLRRNLELCGFKPIIVKETQCSADPKVKYCEYHLKWE